MKTNISYAIDIYKKGTSKRLNRQTPNTFDKAVQIFNDIAGFKSSVDSLRVELWVCNPTTSQDIVDSWIEDTWVLVASKDVIGLLEKNGY